MPFVFEQKMINFLRWSIPFYFLAQSEKMPVVANLGVLFYIMYEMFKNQQRIQSAACFKLLPKGAQ